MNLQGAMVIAKNYIIYGDPKANLGSFEPLKGVYNEKNGHWEITCRYELGFGSEKRIRTAKVTIDNEKGELLTFEVLSKE
nr:hypothetical protein [Candidatus Freyarchaeota archaeon]